MGIEAFRRKKAPGWGGTDRKKGKRSRKTGENSNGPSTAATRFNFSLIFGRWKGSDPRTTQREEKKVSGKSRILTSSKGGVSTSRFAQTPDDSKREKRETGARDGNYPPTRKTAKWKVEARPIYRPRHGVRVAQTGKKIQKEKRPRGPPSGVARGEGNFSLGVEKSLAKEFAQKGFTFWSDDGKKGRGP